MMRNSRQLTTGARRSRNSLPVGQTAPVTIDRDTTADRILAAAEHLLAEHGIDGTSLRAITERAAVNVAAVNYHFGSKEALTLAVFDRLAERVNNRRLADLEQILADAREKGVHPDLREIIVCFIRPYFDPSPGESSPLLAQLVLQHRIAPSAVTREIIKRHFDPMAKRFIEALTLSCPAVDPTSLYWRYMFMTGAVVMTATDQARKNRLAKLSGGKADMSDRGAAFDELVCFLMGAIATP